MSIYTDYADLHQEKKKIEAALDDKKEEIRKAEEALLADMRETGMSTIKLDDGRTLWLDHKFWAGTNSDQEIEVIAETLDSAGYEWLVSKSVNRNKLSAWVREFAGPLDTPEQVRAAIPDGLGEIIKVTETNNVRVRGL